MEVIRTIAHLTERIQEQKKDRRSIGFVPTMGFLHEGHLSLASRARKENDYVVMSIFVNPTQFGPGEDFETYPRNEAKDLQLAKEVGVDLVFMPSVEEMYPRAGTISILPGKQAEALCGKSRPGHFDGVLRVILKLFNLVQADRAYFGMKDAQQLAIIETFVEEFNFQTAIQRVPTVREFDGLAKSSRNVRLSEKERQEAPAIYDALLYGQELFKQQLAAETIEKEVAQKIEMATSGSVDYVTLLSYPTLTPFKGDSAEVILAAAVQFEQARLIDNLLIKVEG